MGKQGGEPVSHGDTTQLHAGSHAVSHSGCSHCLDGISGLLLGYLEKVDRRNSRGDIERTVER